MEDHSSLRYSDGEDDKTDLEVSSILLELSQPVYFSYDPSPCSLKWGRTKKRTFSDIMPPPRISSEPVIQPQPMTEVVGSNYSSSYSTGDAKKTNSQSVKF
ncbi:unnamed protein product [Microthlaspi erraticum]|uniref:Uncharacterized protein n=1 Tax=Microthlaspi erraticum TaxID=1685480 RepID=A0A6D2JGJ0_9BRAS|nr:unnamed protein product [Microthlaspi erraticum]